MQIELLKNPKQEIQRYYVRRSSRKQ